MAGIKRPVYGMQFAGNAADVNWLGDPPDWTIDRSEKRDDFVKRATELWRQRWLSRAIDRISDYAIAPSLVGQLAQGPARNEDDR
jgi:hypothetical protein